MRDNNEVLGELIAFPRAYEVVQIPWINQVKFSYEQIYKISPLIGHISPKYIHDVGINVFDADKNINDALIGSLVFMFNSLKNTVCTKPNNFFVKSINFQEKDTIILGAKRLPRFQRTEIINRLFSRTNELLEDLSSPYRI